MRLCVCSFNRTVSSHKFIGSLWLRRGQQRRQSRSRVFALRRKPAAGGRATCAGVARPPTRRLTCRRRQRRRLRRYVRASARRVRLCACRAARECEWARQVSEPAMSVSERRASPNRPPSTACEAPTRASSSNAWTCNADAEADCDADCGDVAADSLTWSAVSVCSLHLRATRRSLADEPPASCSADATQAAAADAPGRVCAPAFVAAPKAPI